MYMLCKLSDFQAHRDAFIQNMHLNVILPFTPFITCGFYPWEFSAEFLCSCICFPSVLRIPDRHNNNFTGVTVEGLLRLSNHSSRYLDISLPRKRNAGFTFVLPVEVALECVQRRCWGCRPTPSDRCDLYSCTHATPAVADRPVDPGAVRCWVQDWQSCGITANWVSATVAYLTEIANRSTF